MVSTTPNPGDKPLIDIRDQKVLFSIIGGTALLLIVIIAALWCACCPGSCGRRRPRSKRVNAQTPVIISNPEQPGTSTVVLISQPRAPAGRNKRRKGNAEFAGLKNKPSMEANKYLQLEVPSPKAVQRDDNIATDPTMEQMAKYFAQKVTKVLTSIEIKSTRIVKQGELGSGRFGVVYKGLLTDEHSPKQKKIALKTLAGDMHDETNIQEFLDEVLKMVNFKHPNVMPILGLTIMDGKPYIVLPFMENGDLKSYILKKKVLRVNDLLQMAKQVTRGMDYLGRQNLIHGDLAARNCMMDRKLRVKVADFGLARHLYQSDYYTAKNNEQTPRPIRWMAIESILNNKFSPKSDVWSFGILLWELMTRGCQPYPALLNSDIGLQIQKGYRMPRPDLCSNEIYEIMTKCWDEDPHNRPSFTNIEEMISNILDEENNAYLTPKNS